MKERIKTRMICALAAASLAMATGGVATAGSASDPEITDVVGDANTYLGGRDTRPLSIDSADILAAWFETAFVTNKIRDPETSEILRVEHVATGLRVLVRTEAPIQPTWQGQKVNYQIQSGSSNNTAPRYYSAFVLQATPGQSADTATLYPECFPCGSGTAIAGSLNYSGKVATLYFSFTDSRVAEKLHVGTRLGIAKVTAFPSTPLLGDGLPAENPQLFFDNTPGGTTPRTFIVGSDIPPEVDCAAAPDNPECAG